MPWTTKVHHICFLGLSSCLILSDRMIIDSKRLIHLPKYSTDQFAADNRQSKEPKFSPALASCCISFLNSKICPFPKSKSTGEAIPYSCCCEGCCECVPVTYRRLVPDVEESEEDVEITVRDF
ncbi:MAG: hypothetical protein MHMPM18_004873 [Marteilia pararefringens]